MLNYIPHTQSNLTRSPKGGEMQRSEGKRMGGCDACIISFYSNGSVLNSLIDIPLILFCVQGPVFLCEHVI